MKMGGIHRNDIIKYLAVIIVTLVIVTLAVVITFNTYKNQFVNEVYDDLKNESAEYADFFEKEMTTNLSCFAVFGEIIKPYIVEETGALTDVSILNQLNNHEVSGTIDSYYYINHLTGNIYFLNDKSKIEITNQDLTQYEWYDITEESNKPTLSNIYINPRISKCCITVSYAIKCNNQVCGVLCGDIILEDLSRYYFDITDDKNMGINVVSPDGIIMINPKAWRIGELFPLFNEDESDKQFQSTMSWDDIIEQPTGQTEFISLAGEQVMSCYSTCESLRWKVFAISKNSFVQTTLREYFILLISMGILGAVIFLIFIFWGMNREQQYDNATGLQKADSIYHNITKNNRSSTPLIFIKINNSEVLTSILGGKFEQRKSQYAKQLEKRFKRDAKVTVAGKNCLVISFKNLKNEQNVQALIEQLKLQIETERLAINAHNGRFHILMLLVHLPNKDKNLLAEDVLKAEKMIVNTQYNFEGFIELNLADIIKKSDDEMNQLKILRKAMKEDGLIPFYQPIFNLKTNTIDKYEVLMRIKHDNETLLPYPFVLLGEKYNLIKEMDLMVVKKALAYKVQADKNQQVVFSFNISGKCLSNEQYLKEVSNMVSNYHINPKTIHFEITETSTIDNFDTLVEIINRYASQGYGFLIDDFGTAYSTIDYVKKIPCDYVKIDGSFIKDINTSEQNGYLAQSIVLMAKAYNKKTIAEYVESEDILATIKQIGVDYAQGYYFGRPSPTIK